MLKQLRGLHSEILVELLKSDLVLSIEFVVVDQIQAIHVHKSIDASLRALE